MSAPCIFTPFIRRGGGGGDGGDGGGLGGGGVRLESYGGVGIKKKRREGDDISVPNT